MIEAIAIGTLYIIAFIYFSRRAVSQLKEINTVMMEMLEWGEDDE